MGGKFCQSSNFPPVTAWEHFKDSGGRSSLICLLTKLFTNNTVYRTAPAPLGLIKTGQNRLLLGVPFFNSVYSFNVKRKKIMLL